MKAIAERTLGAYPLSIATSLAMESLAGVHPEITVEKAPLTDGTQELWVNIRTLTRNLLGSMARDQAGSVLPTEVGIAIADELRQIETVTTFVSNGLCRVVYYFPTYKGIQKRFPKSTIKQAVTPGQRFAQSLDFDIQKYLESQVGGVDIRTLDIDLVGKHPKSYILTHYPVDLLSKPNFSNLRLVESHTGAIKASMEWNTKLTNGKDLLNMPFNAFTLQVFGDSGNLFSPKSIRHKNTVKELAEKFNWNATTTRDRILLSVRSLPNSDIKADLMQMII